MAVSTKGAVEEAAPAEDVQLLTAAEILAADDIIKEVVHVPEWGGSVLVRGMTGIDRDAFERSMVDIRGKDVQTNWTNLRAKLIARTVIDHKGKLVFDSGQVLELGRKSGKALDRVYEVAQRLSGIGDKDVEDLTAALKDDPSADSGSD